MPRNTPAGIVLAVLSAACAVGLIWYVWWLAALSFAGVIGYAVFHTFDRDREFYVPAAEVARTERARTFELMAEVRS